MRAVWDRDALLPFCSFPFSVCLPGSRSVPSMKLKSGGKSRRRKEMVPLPHNAMTHDYTPPAKFSSAFLFEYGTQIYFFSYGECISIRHLLDRVIRWSTSRSYVAVSFIQRFRSKIRWAVMTLFFLRLCMIREQCFILIMGLCLNVIVTNQKRFRVLWRTNNFVRV